MPGSKVMPAVLASIAGAIFYFTTRAAKRHAEEIQSLLQGAANELSNAELASKKRAERLKDVRIIAYTNSRSTYKPDAEFEKDIRDALYAGFRRDVMFFVV